MEQDLSDELKQQEKVFKDAQKEFKRAQAAYLKACQQYQPFLIQGVLAPPPLLRAAYSDRMAWILATMANLAYIPFEEQEEEYARLELNLKSGEFQLVETFNAEDTQVFLARNADYAVLSFRGTQIDSIRDINTDIQASRLYTKAGKVHTGFIHAYQNVAADVEKALKKIKGLPLYITGHSLGGALATIAAQQLEGTFGDQIAACYTFGSPRVGNDDYDQSIKAAFYRIVNCTDGVALVPLLSMGYTHIGDLRYLTRRGELRRGTHNFLRMWELFAASLLSFPKFWAPLVNAHSLDEYVQKLEKLALARNKKNL
jgi:hypothetical protein